MKRVKDKKTILDYEHATGPITWADFRNVTAGRDILDTDIIECGPIYSSTYEGEQELDGYFITVTRNTYETDEEERLREERLLEWQIENQKREAEDLLKRRNAALAEHERLSKLFNPIPKS